MTFEELLKNSPTATQTNGTNSSTTSTMTFDELVKNNQTSTSQSSAPYAIPQTSSTYVAQPKSFLKQAGSTVNELGKDAVRFAARLGVNAYNAGRMVIPGGATARTIDPNAEVNVPWVGKVRPVGQSGNFTRDVIDAYGVGLEASSWLPITRGLGTLARVGWKGAAMTGLKMGAKEGLFGGTMYGLGREMQNPDATVGSVAGSGAIGGAAGAVGGAVLGTVMPVAGLGARAIYSKARGLPYVGPKNIAQRELGKTYDDIARYYAPTRKSAERTAAATAAKNAAGTIGVTPQQQLAELGVVPRIEGTQFATGVQAVQVAEQAAPLRAAVREALQQMDSTAPTGMVRLSDMEAAAIKAARSSRNIASGSSTKLVSDIRREFANYRREFGETITLTQADEIKTARWYNAFERGKAVTRADQLTNDVDYLIGRSAKDTIESIAARFGDPNIAQVNRLMGDLLESAKFLKDLDGRAVLYGRMGTHMLKLTGALAGASHGPLGALGGAIGMDYVASILRNASVAGPVKRMLLAQVRKEMANQPPEVARQMEAWLREMVSERETRLALPAGAIRTPEPRGTASVSAVPAKKTYGQSAQTGRFFRAYTSEAATDVPKTSKSMDGIIPRRREANTEMVQRSVSGSSFVPRKAPARIDERVRIMNLELNSWGRGPNIANQASRDNIQGLWAKIQRLPKIARSSYINKDVSGSATDVYNRFVNQRGTSELEETAWNVIIRTLFDANGKPRKNSFGPFPRSVVQRAVNFIRSLHDDAAEITQRSVAPNNTNILTEARKYKSADDFVKAQGTPVYHGSKKDITVDDFYRLPKKEVFDAEARGRQDYGAGAYFYADKSDTKRFGKYTVEAYTAPEANIKTLTAKEWRDLDDKIRSLRREKAPEINLNEMGGGEFSRKSSEFTRDYLLEQGVDGLVITGGRGSDLTVIYNPKVLKTRSQLEDIWKQAQGTEMTQRSVAPNKKDVAYHVTNTENAASIDKNGVVAPKGTRFRNGKEEPIPNETYVWKDRADAERFLELQKNQSADSGKNNDFVIKEVDVTGLKLRKDTERFDEFVPGAGEGSGYIVEGSIPASNIITQRSIMPNKQKYFGDTRRIGTTGQYVGAPKGVTTHQKLAALEKKLSQKFEAGRNSVGWYRKSAEHIINTLGNKEDAVTFAKLLGIYSPNTSTDINYRRAAMAFQRYKDGLPIEGGGMKNMDKMANDVLYKDMPIRGNKISAFAQNIIKYIDPSLVNTEAVTNDLWMMRAFGYLKKESGMATKQHEFMTNMIQRIAKKYAVSPDEAQAAIWTAERNKGSTPSQLLRGDASFEKVAEKLVTQISWEAAPSKTSGLFPELFNAPWSQRMKYHAKIEAAFNDDNGRNMIFDLLGIPQRKALRAPGVFEGQVSPGTQFIVEVPMMKGNPYKIDPIAYEKLQAASAIMGKLSFQDSVAFGKAIPAKRVMDANAAVIDIGRVLTKDEAIALDKALTDSGIPYGLVSEPRGVKVLIFDDTLPQKQWRGIIDKAAADVLPDGRAKLYVNHGELVDKASADYGQNYMGALASRRQDIQRGRDILDTIERRVEDVIEQTKREYGWTDNRAADDPWRAIKWDDLGPGGDGGTTQRAIGPGRNGGAGNGSVLPEVRRTFEPEVPINERRSVLPQRAGGGGGGVTQGGRQVPRGGYGGIDFDYNDPKALDKYKRLVSSNEATRLNFLIQEGVPAERRNKFLIREAFAGLSSYGMKNADMLMKHMEEFVSALPKTLQENFNGIKLSKNPRGELGMFSISRDGKWSFYLNPHTDGAEIIKSGAVFHHEVGGHMVFEHMKPKIRAQVMDILAEKVLTDENMMRRLYSFNGRIDANGLTSDGVLGAYNAYALIGLKSRLKTVFSAYGFSDTAASKHATDVLSELGLGKIKVNLGRHPEHIAPGRKTPFQMAQRVGTAHKKIYEWLVENGYGDVRMGMDTQAMQLYHPDAASNTIMHETFARVMEESLTNGVTAVPELADIIGMVAKREKGGFENLLGPSDFEPKL